MGNAKARDGAGTAWRPDPLLSHLAVLPAITQGKELVLAKAGDIVELPCKASLKKIMPFHWKHPSQVKILGSQGSFWVTGKVAQFPVQGENTKD